jgi:hypothetical protein
MSIELQNKISYQSTQKQKRLSKILKNDFEKMS